MSNCTLGAGKGNVNDSIHNYFLLTKLAPQLRFKLNEIPRFFLFQFSVVKLISYLQQHFYTPCCKSARVCGLREWRSSKEDMAAAGAKSRIVTRPTPITLPSYCGSFTTVVLALCSCDSRFNRSSERLSLFRYYYCYGLQVPPVTREVVQTYLLPFDKELEQRIQFPYHKQCPLCVHMAPPTDGKTFVRRIQFNLLVYGFANIETLKLEKKKFKHKLSLF